MNNSKIINKTANSKIWIVYLLAIIIILICSKPINADLSPTPVDNITLVSTNLPPVTQSLQENSSGGSITEVLLNISEQNTRWKAYVGNVTGELGLRDSSGNQLYDWSLTIVTGEIYAIRNYTDIDWATVRCANITNILQEEQYLGQDSSLVDTINKTFNQQAHNTFYVGTNIINTNTCKSTNMFVNNVSQALSYQEVLLFDNSTQSLIFTSLLEPNSIGYNSKQYHFQILLPGNATPGAQNSIPYYFYIELV